MGTYNIDQIYFALENGYGNSWVAMDGADIHQAFNPIQGDIEVPKPKFEEELVTLSNSLDYNEDLSYDKDKVPGKGQFPGGDGLIYRDPFLFLTAFTHKTKTGTWEGGAATYGKLTGDFTAIDDRSSIMIQAGSSDGVTPLNRCYNGGLVTSYQIGFKKGGLLRSVPEFSIADFQVNTQAFVPDSDFDNGYWSLWALKGATQKFYHASDCKLYWDDSHVAELAGLKIEDCRVKISIPKDQESDHSALVHKWEWDKNRLHEAVVSGILYGNTEYLEAEKSFQTKSKKDLRFSWDQTTNEQKWVQLDSAWIVGLTTQKLPSKENALRIEYTFKGQTSQFEGNYENRPDPLTRVDTTP